MPDQSIAAAIESLPPWEKQLLQHLVLEVPEATLIEAILSEHIIIVCDGSAHLKTNQASFGWRLATATKRHLAHCNGPAYGYKATSYRAEGYGILSCLRFLYRLRQAHNITAPISIELLCDNISMITETPKDYKLDKIAPNSTLDSDWGVLAEIWTSMKCLDDSWRPNPKHIKGHQDKETPYHELSFRAQLNDVDADGLAEQYIDAYPDHPYQQVLLLPTSGAQIHLLQGTLTYKYK